MKIIIGTTNPGKIEGARLAFGEYFKDFEIVGVKADSKVSEQPVDYDIYLGAKNRALGCIDYCKENNIDADYFIAVESGITDSLGKWVITNVAVILTKEGFETWGTSASFPVPDKYVEDIKEKTLGAVMDSLFKKDNLHSGTGGVGLLTHNKISRIELTRQSFIMALTQIINDNWKD